MTKKTKRTVGSVDQVKNNSAFKEWELENKVVAMALMDNDRISRLIGPYMALIPEREQAGAWIKIIASLLMMDKDAREDCLVEVFDDEADFLRMYVEAIEAIIDEEVDEYTKSMEE